MTIYDYVLAQADARKRIKRLKLPACYRQLPMYRISIAGDLGGEPIRRVYPQRDARRKWVRAA